MNSERYYHLTDEALTLEFCPPDLSAWGSRRKQKHAYIETYRRFWGRVFFVAFKHLKKEHAAEKVVHEVFLFLWNKRDVFKIASLDIHLAALTRYMIYRALADERFLHQLRNADLTPLPKEMHLDAEFTRTLLLDIVHKRINTFPLSVKIYFRPVRKQVQRASKAGIKGTLTKVKKKISTLFKS